MVLVYKIQNQWSNALIIAKKNISFEAPAASTANGSQTSSSANRGNDLELNSSEATLYYYGPGDGFSTFYAQPELQTLCDVEVELTDFYDQKVEAQWNYGQPFDGGLYYNLMPRWLGYSGALLILRNAHEGIFPDSVIAAFNNSIKALYEGRHKSGIFDFAEDRVGPGDTLLIARKSPQDTVLDEDKNFRVLGVLSKYEESLK